MEFIDLVRLAGQHFDQKYPADRKRIDRAHDRWKKKKQPTTEREDQSYGKMGVYFEAFMEGYKAATEANNLPPIKIHIPDEPRKEGE